MPLKLNNERLPGKNTMILAGKPLFYHQLIAAKRTNIVDDIYVFCSSSSIKDIIPSGIHFLKRDESLDLPSSNFNQIFKSFMDEINADIYVYIHATAPYIKSETIKECIEAVKSGEFDSAFCAVKIQDFLWKDGKPLNFDATNLPRSQDLETIYRETSGVYVFKKEVFTTLHRRIGNNPFIKSVSFKESIDINNKEDFELAKIFENIDL